LLILLEDKPSSSLPATPASVRVSATIGLEGVASFRLAVVDDEVSDCVQGLALFFFKSESEVGRLENCNY